MIVLNLAHHDLEVVYAIRFRDWKQADKHNLQRRSQLLGLALDNLRDAGFTPEQIAGIERHVERQLAGVYDLDDGGQ